MKYCLAFVGMLMGQMVGGLVADSRLLDWTLGTILFAIGYCAPNFISYMRASPKQRLAFHGPDSPVSRSTSSGELRTLISQLREGRLLLDIDPRHDHAAVEETQSYSLAESERITMAQVLLQAKTVHGNPSDTIRILARDGRTLECYKAAEVAKRARDIAQ